MTDARERLVAQAVQIERAQGCCCFIVVRIGGPVAYTPWGPVYVPTTLHDRWCPRIRALEGPVEGLRGRLL